MQADREAGPAPRPDPNYQPDEVGSLYNYHTPSLMNIPSVIGLISIPGTMTGSILGGASVTQAARLQMILMFLISSVAVLSSIMATGFALMIVVDRDHRIRIDRIDSSKFIVWRYRERLFTRLGELGSRALSRIRDPLGKRGQIRLDGE